MGISKNFQKYIHLQNNNKFQIEEKCKEVNAKLNEKESEFSRQRQEYEEKIALLLKFHNLDCECKLLIFIIIDAYYIHFC